MDYAADYSDRLRYGRLRERAEWEPFVKAYLNAIDENRGAVDHTPALVLADFLDAGGDPRADVIRRPHEREEPLTRFWSDRVGLGTHIFSDHTFRLGHNGTAGPIQVEVYGSHNGRPERVNLEVSFPHDLVEANGAYIGRGIHREADFTPEEARDFADRLPEPHSTALHGILDRHFGPRS